jgi:hypothetical protein
MTMLDGYRIFDADAHTMMSPRMWADLPEEFVPRRPRAVRISDESGLGYWNTGWYVDGRLEPHPFGPGAQSANTPAMVLDEFQPALGKPRAAIGSNDFPVPLASLDLSDPQARLQNLERMAVDTQMLFPSVSRKCQVSAVSVRLSYCIILPVVAPVISPSSDRDRPRRQSKAG